MKTQRPRGSGRPGMPGYARILAHAVHKCPLTTVVLVGQFGMHPDGAADVLNALHASCLTYISGWHRVADRGPFMPEFSMRLVGDEQEADYPGARPRRAAWHRPRPTCIALANLLDALMAPHEGVSVAELMESTGLCKNTTQRMVKLLVSLKLAYISDWPPSMQGMDHGPRMPAYRFGINRTSKAKPKAMSRAELYRREWQVKKARNAQVRTLRALAGKATRHDMQALAGKCVNANSFKQRA